MSYKCDICGKGPLYGHAVSHAHNVTGRRFLPNLRTVRARSAKGTVRKIRVCARCIKSGRVRKP